MAAHEVLHQGRLLLEHLDDATYVRKLPAAFNSAIGSHYRHCLDHFTVLLSTPAGEEVNYDRRERDLRIETDRTFALEVTQRLLQQCEFLGEQAPDRPLAVRAKVSYIGEDSPVAASTLGRELMYVVIHAVHHYALISFICHSFGIPLPAGFGVAPSTVQHHKAQAA